MFVCCFIALFIVLGGNVRIWKAICQSWQLCLAASQRSPLGKGKRKRKSSAHIQFLVKKIGCGINHFNWKLMKPDFKYHYRHHLSQEGGGKTICKTFSNLKWSHIIPTLRSLVFIPVCSVAAAHNDISKQHRILSRLVAACHCNSVLWCLVGCSTCLEEEKKARALCDIMKNNKNSVFKVKGGRRWIVRGPLN